MCRGDGIVTREERHWVNLAGKLRITLVCIKKWNNEDNRKRAPSKIHSNRRLRNWKPTLAPSTLRAAAFCAMSGSFDLYAFHNSASKYATHCTQDRSRFTGYEQMRGVPWRFEQSDLVGLSDLIIVNILTLVWYIIGSHVGICFAASASAPGGESAKNVRFVERQLMQCQNPSSSSVSTISSTHFARDRSIFCYALFLNQTSIIQYFFPRVNPLTWFCS